MVHPHVAVGAGRTALTDDFKGRLVSVGEPAVQQTLMQLVIQEGEMQLRSADLRP